MHMNELPQTAAASDLKVNPNAVFEKAKDGPVMVMSRATQKAVIVSPEYWNSLARELRRLRHLELCDRVSREMDENPFACTVLTGEELLELHRG